MGQLQVTRPLFQLLHSWDRGSFMLRPIKGDGDYRFQSSDQQEMWPVFTLHLAWVFLCNGLHRKPMDMYTRDTQYWAPGFKPDASHAGYQIRNGSKGYEIKSTLVESHEEILDGKKHQDLSFPPVLRESTTEIVANTVTGTEVQYRLKDNVMYLNCNDSDNTYTVCCLETFSSTCPVGLLDCSHIGKATEIAAARDTNVKPEIYRHSQQRHSTLKTRIRNRPQKEQVSWLRLI